MQKIKRTSVSAVIICLLVLVTAVCAAKSEEPTMPFLGGIWVALAILSVVADIMSVKIAPSRDLDGSKAALFVWAFGSKQLDVAVQGVGVLYILSIVATKAPQQFVAGAVFVIALAALAALIYFWANGKMHFFVPAPSARDDESVPWVAAPEEPQNHP